MTVETVPKDILDKLNAGIEISNADFDIRDLNVAQDEVKAVVRADTAANQTDDLKITLNGEDVNVTATNLDIRDLTHASDSVEVFQNKVDTMSYGAVEVDDEVTTVLNAHAGRTGFIIVNNSAQTVYLGGDAVTTVNGLPLDAGASYENQLWVGAIYGIVAAGTADLRVEDFYT